jgi:hypothetical protein
MRWTGFNKNGYYTVGHSAILLINKNYDSCHYFDFGRYHAPKGMGRVRCRFTDHDLKINTKPIWSESGALLNKRQILHELYLNKSCHGSGHLIAAVSDVNYNKSLAFVKKQQRRVFIKYGPLVWNGTNCSRFVSGVLGRGELSLLKRLRLNFQYSISASPYGNVKALGGEMIIINQRKNDDSVHLIRHKELSMS